ncbi:Biliverdin-producing heme oxygenase [Burkholderiales bacterium 8X]|nr:Biliverdin-producing heme oxygenase [Burkholderiales bacterium 8X]
MRRTQRRHRGAGLSERLPERLRQDTRELHLQVERSGLIHSLLRGAMARSTYVQLLRNLHAVYAALEDGLRRNAEHPALAPLNLPELWREARLAHDLDFLQGSGWRGIDLQPAALSYVRHLDAISVSEPVLLIAHGYVRYLGDLSGGQLLARVVRESFGLTASDEGAAFYDFGGAGQAAALKAAFRLRLTALDLDESTDDAIVAEALRAFERHAELFAELAKAVEGAGGTGTAMGAPDRSTPPADAGPAIS